MAMCPALAINFNDHADGCRRPDSLCCGDRNATLPIQATSLPNRPCDCYIVGLTIDELSVALGWENHEIHEMSRDWVIVG